MIILGLYIGIFVAMVILAAWVNDVMNGAPGGHHTKPDAPTLGDALADWLGERLDGIRGCVHVAADDIAHWHPWRTLQIGVWTRQLRTDWRLRPAVRDLREPAAAGVPGEGTVPASPPGAVPLDVRVTASGGFPAVGIRPGKQPWLTDEQPRLPEYLP